jgi:hypothetical protein
MRPEGGLKTPSGVACLWVTLPSLWFFVFRRREARRYALANPVRPAEKQNEKGCGQFYNQATLRGFSDADLERDLRELAKDAN